MRQTAGKGCSSCEKIVKDIKRATRKQYSAEEKIRIVLDGLRGEDSLAELCRKEGISQGIYYKWSKDFMEAGKRRLAGDTARAATTDEVKALRREARDLKEVVAEQTLDKLGVPRTTFYRWYDRYLQRGEAALSDKAPRPTRVWNRIPDDVRDKVVKLALDEPELSPRELAVMFTDTEQYFVSEASVYRMLKAHDMITSPAYIVVKAASEFKDKTTAINQLWQTDFT